MFTAMYWPLLGGFIVFVLFAILMGWITDSSRRGRDGHRAVTRARLSGVARRAAARSARVASHSAPA